MGDLPFHWPRAAAKGKRVRVITLEGVMEGKLSGFSSGGYHQPALPEAGAAAATAHK